MLTVWVTRDEAHDGPLAAALGHVGLAVRVEPVVRRAVAADPQQLVAHLTDRDWLVLTSPFAARAMSCAAARTPRVAVIGESTKAAAASSGMNVALTATSASRDVLFAELRRTARDGIICYPRSSQATPPTAWAGVQMESPVLYHTEPCRFDRSVMEIADIAVFTSASAVRCVGRMELPAAAIGPRTAAALRAMGIRVVVTSPVRRFAVLAEAIAGYARSSRHHRA